MATLVLTAVGGALGGPVGAALGSLAGSYVDRELLLRPGRRAGPRLSELRVQTSSYGSPVPALFGTMRVAGTVIWATDLIETRAASRRKGSPEVTHYSYAASFAVALSSRPVRRLGRVWADGTLLVGAAGDLKVAGAMRLHRGGEAQAADPLIASAEGAPTPAHRGMAYVVFEGLALASFGNRIPSLSFEVVADDAPVAIGALAQVVADEVTGATAAGLDGFAASGSARGVLDLLGAAAGGWFAAAGGRIGLSTGDGAAVTIADGGVAAADARGARRGRSVAPPATVPRTLSLGHYDAARDYQAGVQRAVRAGAGWREERVDMPALLAAPAAKAMAAAMLARADAERTRRTVTLGLDGLALSPGAVVTIAGEAGRWRIEALLVERWATRATLVPLAPPPVPVPAASPGRVLPAPDLVVGRTLLHVAELPALDDRADAVVRLTVAATGAGRGWRAAALLLSLDGGASWQEAGGTAAPAIVGRVEQPPGPAPAALVDRRNDCVVRLARADMMLGDADAAALARGANLALIGDELVQFGRATPMGGGRWRLTALWRGRRGSEAAIGGAAAGDRFVLLEGATLRTIDLPAQAIGTAVRVMAAGIGDGAAGVVVTVAVTGASVAPPAPAGLIAQVAADGATTLRWTRRSRLGWGWIDGVDAPLGEEREAYRVAIDAGEERWNVETDRPALTIPARQVAGRALRIAVHQRGTVAESMPARLTLPAKG